MTGNCGANRACTLATLNGQPSGTCRSRTGAVGEGGDCGDFLDFGTAINSCADGTICLPADTNGDFVVATCNVLCNPVGANTCPTAGTTCGAFNTPFDSFGVCF